MTASPTEPHYRFQFGQTLLLDADDTLWENNIYFERAITAFISYLDHNIHSPEEVREQLNHCERATIAEHGYGLQSFRRSLIKCFELLSDQPVTPEKHARIVAFTETISAHEIEVLSGVQETLEDLGQRHTLILVTKGNHEEQNDKLMRSGLRTHFASVEVLQEKNTAAYARILSRYALKSSRTWMIGNSPRSDINPALSVGINAVFIPHDFTWVLEHEVVNSPAPDRHLLKLARFADLKGYF